MKLDLGYFLRWSFKKCSAETFLNEEGGTGLHKLCARLQLCMKTVLHVKKNLCMVLIPLCKNNLNLRMCSSFFFLPCALLLLLLFIVLSCLLPRCAALIFLSVCFYRSRFCYPAINQISDLLVNLKAGFHSFYFADRKNTIE